MSCRCEQYSQVIQLTEIAFRVYKEHLKLSRKRQTIQIEKMAKERKKI